MIYYYKKIKVAATVAYWQGQACHINWPFLILPTRAEAWVSQLLGNRGHSSQVLNVQPSQKEDDVIFREKADAWQ